MAIIDAHVHLFPPDLIACREETCQRDRWFGLLYASPNAPMASVEALIAEMDASGVDRSVVFGFAFADAGLCRVCNDYVLSAAQAHPGRLLPFLVTNPAIPDDGTVEAERCLALGARGIGELMPDGQGFALDSGQLDPLAELAKAHSVPIMCHVNERVGHRYPGKGQHGPDQAWGLVTRHPETTWILPHWGGGLPFYELMPSVRPLLRNVYYDTSASLFLYDDAIFRHVMAWAPDKVLFGTDYPLIGQKRFLRRVRRAVEEPGQLAALLGGNALRALGESGQDDSGGGGN